MGTTVRLVSYAAALAVVFGGAWTAGSAFGSPPAPAAAVHEDAVMAPADDAGRVWQGDGYQVRLDGDLVAGASSQVFATISRDGAAVTDLEPDGTGYGRLVGVRTGDLGYLPLRTGGPAPGPYAHAGPSIAFVADAPPPGTYRLFLTFTHAGAEHTAAFTVSTRGMS